MPGRFLLFQVFRELDEEPGDFGRTVDGWAITARQQRFKMSISMQESALETGEHSKPRFNESLSSVVRFRAGMGLFLALLVVSIVLAAGVGAVHVPSRAIISMLANRTG